MLIFGALGHMEWTTSEVEAETADEVAGMTPAVVVEEEACPWGYEDVSEEAAL